MYRLVREFHETFGHPHPDKPTFITEERLKVRRGWADDERAEFDEAFARRDLVGCADAVADELYFLLGTCVEMGLPIDAIVEAVHDANMAKLAKSPPHDFDCAMARCDDGTARCTCGVIEYNEHGKVRKPPGWRGPEARIAAILAKKAAR